jgi:FkbM family methyltransferase
MNVHAARKVIRMIWTHPANRDQRVRQLTVALRFQARARILKRPTLVPLGKNSVVLSRHAVASSSKAAYANPPDWEMAIWRRILRPSDLFLDVGANIGLYSIWALDCGARVIAIEPLGELVEQLTENLALNGYHAEVIQAALADFSGSAGLTGRDLNTHHLILETSLADTQTPVAPVLTLDEVLGDMAAAGAKIDVEGAELLVLRGGQKAFSERRIGVLQLEWNHTSEALLGMDRGPVADFLHSFGYQLLRHDEKGNLRPLSDHRYGSDIFACLPEFRDRLRSDDDGGSRLNLST